MAVNKAERGALRSMWDEAKPNGANCAFPEGVFQFKIVGARFSSEKKPCVISKLRIIGGLEDAIGAEGEIRDNLESKENMGWFKAKLARLNVEPPESFDELETETPGKLVGLCFEGQVKIKGGFCNVYVNRLLDSDSAGGAFGGGEAEAGTEEPAAEETAAEEAPAEADASAEVIEKGDLVTWTRKSGAAEKVEVVSVDGDKAVIFSKADDKKYKVDLSALEIVYVEDGAPKEAAEEEPAAEDASAGGFTMPNLTTLKGMKSSDLTSELFEPLGVDMDNVQNPKQVAITLAHLAKDPEAKLKPSEVKEAADALGVKAKKGETPTQARKAVADKLAKLLAAAAE